MHGVRNFPWNPILFALPSKISDLRIREREILRRKGSMKSHIQTYAGYSSSAWCYSLWPCLFFFCFSLFLCSVCVLALFLCIYLPFSVCALQFIEELRSSFPLFLLLTDQFMGLFESVFLPQFLTSWLAMPHYLHFSDSWQVTPFLLRCGVL